MSLRIQLMPLLVAGQNQMARYSIAKVYASIRPCDELKRWRHIVWSHPGFIRHKLHLWLLVHNALPLKARLYSWGVVDTPHCPVSAEAPEDRDHLVVGCVMPMSCWWLLMNWLKLLYTPLSWSTLSLWLQSVGGRLRIRGGVFHAIFARLMHKLWGNRNAAGFDKSVLGPQLLFRRVVRDLFVSLLGRKVHRVWLKLLDGLDRTPCTRNLVSRMVVQGFTVDLNKPLVFQVGHLGETYQDWVHQPIVSKEGPRFFKNDILEFLTLTVWWAIPAIWLPVVCWCIFLSLMMGHTLSEVTLMVGFGIFIWTLLEYTLHRFLFHIETRSYWTNTIHYLLHGCHHKHPMDGLRLVFPPAATAILCVPFWNLVKLFATPSTTPALFGGGLLGYVMYDVTHYYLHHGQPTSSIPRHLKKYHLNHHFRIENKGFGITSSLWDRVFGTLPPSKTTKKGT